MTIQKLQLLNASRTNGTVPKRGRSRGVPPALERYEIFSSNVIREAEKGIEEVLGPHRLTVQARDTSNFRASLHAARLRDITFGYLDYRVAAEITCELPTNDYFFVFMPTNGSGTFWIGNSTLETSTAQAFVAPLRAPLRFSLDSDSPHLFIRVSRMLLERQLSRMLGRSLRSEITFDYSLNQFSQLSMRWLSAIQLLHEEIANPTPLSRIETGLTSLEDYIATTLLLIQPSNYSQALQAPGRTPASRTLRRAIEFIDIHLAEEITMSDLARATGCSVRTLQSAFSSELDTSAITYIRDQRLQRVHDELRDSSRLLTEMVSIAEVARSWGFTHMGRFAAFYHSRFGENPSDTLARSN
ncbi:MAG: AraC family transcriptional regulator [Ferrimicrobium sp.]